MALHLASGPWRSLVAIALAISASGTGDLARGGSHHAAHVCRCHHGPDDDCDCKGCHRALRAQAEDADLPPCHRAAARARLARAAKPPRAPCVKGSCGGEDEDTPRAPKQDPVVLSPAPTLPRLPVPRSATATAEVPGRGAGRPATPPPRAC